MFLPLGDDNSRRRIFPAFVWLIVGINAFVWFLELTLGEPFIYGFSAIPYELTRGVDLLTAQVVSTPIKPLTIPQAPGPSPIYLTLFVSMFMHGSWMHIIGNMLYLLIFGDQIEDLLGHGRFLVFYLVCGIAASVAHIAIDPSSPIPTLGASGAIAGVLGGYLLRYPQNKVRVLVGRHLTVLPAYFVLGGWIIIQLIAQVSVFGGAATGVAYMAHIGGFFAGLLLLPFLASRTRSEGH